MNFNNAAKAFVGVADIDGTEQVVCFTGVISLPMKKGVKRIHRLVVLPDYQGVGIGMHFLNAVARIVTGWGYECLMTTTTPAIVPALKRSPCWALSRYGRCESGFSIAYNDTLAKGSERLKKSSSANRYTLSFWYVPSKDPEAGQ